MSDNVGVIKSSHIIQKLYQSFKASLCCVEEPCCVEVYPKGCSVATVMSVKVGNKQVVHFLLGLWVCAAVKHSTSDVVGLEEAYVGDHPQPWVGLDGAGSRSIAQWRLVVKCKRPVPHWGLHRGLIGEVISLQGLDLVLTGCKERRPPSLDALASNTTPNTHHVLHAHNL